MSSQVAIVIAALVGVIGTLSGALMSQFFQHRHERWKAGRDDRQLLQSKAEELHRQLDRINREANEAFFLTKFENGDEEASEFPIPSLSEIHGLIGVYFPEFLDEIEAFRDVYMPLSKQYNERIATISDPREMQEMKLSVSGEGKLAVLRLVHDVRSKLRERAKELSE